ncbi:4-hydroxylaminobenzoate lyase [Trinickia mobilis]|uniref:4-hydroxylaminobenzoate lyase n=1 Tax=Trinickia mobilis TaxID=2816356 RepID=UPI001A8CE58E|nr:DUF4863 family protein [Trinickia mobilis]
MLPSGPHKERLLELVHEVCAYIGNQPFDDVLGQSLNSRFGAGTPGYEEMTQLLKRGVEEKWVAYVEIEGPDYRRGRIAEPTPETAGLSVESGLLANVKGQYHCHTRGEINMIIPSEAGANFCGTGAGWRVFAPMTEHFPTVVGRALMMFFLPGGEIEYRTPPSA